MNYNNQQNQSGSRRKKYNKKGGDNYKNGYGQNQDRNGNNRQQPDERRVNGAMPYIQICDGCFRQQRIILTKRTMKKCNNHSAQCEYVFFIEGGKVVCQRRQDDGKQN